MYLEHFGLFVKPFGISPQLDFLYRSSAFQESMAHLVYGLDNSEAIVMISGPIGSGKTMALQSFLTELGPNYKSALVTNTQVTTIELLKLILEDLDVPIGPGWDKSDLLISFKNFLAESWREGKRVVVVIDEAQNLSPDVLEEVRLLTNLGQGMEQPVQLVLVGQPELKRIVDSPELAQLRQRIRVHYEVDTLDFDEMVGYVNHRMKVAGCDRQVFEPAALERLFDVSGGIPRLVNTHAGDALLSAFVAMKSNVSPLDIDEGIGREAAENDPPKPMDIPAREPRIPEPFVAEPPSRAPEPVAPVPDPMPAPEPPPVSDPLKALEEMITEPTPSRQEPAPPVTPAEPAPAPEPASIQNPEPQAQPKEAYAGYADRRNRRSGGSGWRYLLILVGIVAVLALAVWLSSLMEDGGGTAGLAPADSLQIASANPEAQQESAPMESAVDTTEVAAMDQVEPEIPQSDPVAQPETQPETQPVAQQVESRPEPEVRVEEFDYYIHVASFRDSLRSSVYQGRLTERSMTSRVEKDVVDGDEWFRVYIGPEPTRDSALTLANDLVGSSVLEYYKIVRLARSEPLAANVP